VFYYGDEVGLPGELDPDCRRTFPPEKEWRQDLLNIHRQLIALRHRYPALRTGTYEVLHAEGSGYIFSRTLGSDRILVALNAGAENTVTLSTDTLTSAVKAADAVFTYQGATWAGETLALPPRSAVVATAQ
jgi:cyclomaltodextrinase/neopullulanase